MGPLGSMLSALLLTDLGATVTRVKRNSMLWAITGLFLLTAYVLGVVAAILYLITRMTPLQATLTLAAGSFVIGLVVIGIMYAMEARDKRIAQERRRRSQMQTNIAVATALTLLRKRPLLAAGLAVGAGTVMSFMTKSGDNKT